MPLDTLQVTDAWAQSIAQAWEPGEHAAQQRLAHFADELAAGYATERDRPDRDGTSRLSPHLAWGEISVHAIWRHLTRKLGDKALPFLREIAWRDFNMHLLHDFPDLTWQPMQAKFTAFPAKDHPKMLRAWQRGQTGYPIVDAGMRQLWHTGWMHNRVRMIVASFLVKDLLIPWQRGEEWFWDTLVDADPAQNGGNWQWVAGCGADAAPFFRVFNPVLQGEKFDPKGAYVRELGAGAGETVRWRDPPALDRAEGPIVGRRRNARTDLSAAHRGSRQGATGGARRLSAHFRQGHRKGAGTIPVRGLAVRPGLARPTTPMRKNMLTSPSRASWAVPHCMVPSARGYDCDTIIASHVSQLRTLGVRRRASLSFRVALPLCSGGAPFAGVTS